LTGLRRQHLDLGSHHRKAAPRFARARCLDCRIERQQIGLRRDPFDHRDDVADLVGRLRQRVDRRARCAGAGNRFPAEAAAARHLPRYLGYGLQHLFGQLTRGLVHRARTVGGAGGLVKGRPDSFQRRHHAIGFDLQGRGTGDDGLHTAFGCDLDPARQSGQIAPAGGLPRAVKIVVHQLAALAFDEDVGKFIGGGHQARDFTASGWQRRGGLKFCIGQGIECIGRLRQRARYSAPDCHDACARHDDRGGACRERINGAEEWERKHGQHGQDRHQRQ
jgi:hypothetical protein